MSPCFLMPDCACNLESGDCFLIFVPAELYNSAREKTPPGNLLCVDQPIRIAVQRRVGVWEGATEGRSRNCSFLSLM